MQPITAPTFTAVADFVPTDSADIQADPTKLSEAAASLGSIHTSLETFYSSVISTFNLIKTNWGRGEGRETLVGDLTNFDRYLAEYNKYVASAKKELETIAANKSYN